MAALLMGASVGYLNAQALNYLGIRVGAEGMYEGWEYDSTYSSLTGSASVNLTLAETLQVNQEFTYSGNLGRGILRMNYVSGDTNYTMVYVDTVYEVGNDMHRLMIVGTDSNATQGVYFKKVDVLAIRTPLSVGASWTLGIAGDTVTADVDGDRNYSTPDTMVFLLDTVKVLSMGTLTVPAGTFDSVYTIYVAIRAKLWSSFVYSQAGNSSESWSDTLIRDYYVYWRPGIGLIKDSTYQYALFTPFFVTAEVFSWSVNEMVDYTQVGVAEREVAEREGFYIADGLVRFRNRVTVYDVSGKVVFYGDGAVRLNRGLYMVKEGRRTYKLLIR